MGIAKENLERFSKNKHNEIIFLMKKIKFNGSRYKLV